MKMTRGERIFSIFNYTFLIALALVCLVPYLTLLAKSFSQDSYVISGQVNLIPLGFNFKAYNVLLGNTYFQNAFVNSAIITICGTIVQVFFTACVAYVASKDELPYSGLLTKLYVVTMLFSGGIIPTYLVVKETGLMNNLLVMIIPGMVTGFNMILIRNYFYTLPVSLEESARLDGASNLTILFRIVFPIAIPSIATISIFTAVAQWNNYMKPLLYLTKSNVKVLTIYLQSIIAAADMSMIESPELMDRIASESFRAAAIFISALPILMVYPFLQNYFIKGMTLGAIKQ